MIEAGLIACLVIGIALALQISSPLRSAAAAGLLLLLIVVVPKVVFQGTIDATHTGIAPATPAVATYTFVVAALCYGAFLHRLSGGAARYAPRVLYIFLTWVLLEYIFVWDGTAEQVAGLLQLAAGCAAWVAGSFISRRLLMQSEAVRWLARAIFCLILIEACVTVLQRLGIDIHPMPPALHALMGNRTNGTTPHPDQLGKIIFLLTILALGLLGTADRKTRRLLWLAIIVGFVPLGLSEGRANGIGVIVTLILWALLMPSSRRPLSVRFGVPLLALALALPFLPSFASRFQQDPHGGARADLAQAAYQQIAMRPLWGLGVNSYVTVVAPYDRNTAEGYSVHNAFLLTAAELGIPAAVLFWLPFVILPMMSWRGRRRADYAGTFAQAILAATPGMYVVIATGWGIMEAEVLPLWLFVWGMAYAQIRVGTQRIAVTPRPPADSETPRPRLASV